MARRNKLKIKSKSASKLVTNLESGKQIKGLNGYVGVTTNDDDDIVFIPVTVIGLKTANEESCSCEELLVLGEITGSGSKLSFEVKKWVDSLEEVESHKGLSKAIAKAKEELRGITNHHLLRRQQLALESYILDSMKQPEREAVQEDLSNAKLKTSTLDRSDVLRYAKICVCLANGIAPDQAPYELNVSH